jgi:hypothetical protein
MFRRLAKLVNGVAIFGGGALCVSE